MLDLDFTNGTLPAGVTFARASTGTYLNAAGLIASAASGAPRFNYHPFNGACLGLIVEPSQTNLALHSNGFTNAVWSLGRAAIAANAIAGPDGVAGSAFKLTETTENATHNIRQSINSTTGQVTFSVFVKAAERSRVIINATDYATGEASRGFDLTSGGVFSTGIAAGTWTNVKGKMEKLRGGWWRCSLSANRPSGGSDGITISLDNGSANSYTGTAGYGVYIWGAQKVLGDSPGTYIPTTTAAVTRAADEVSVTGSNFSAWYKATEGTFIADFERFGFSAGGLFSARADVNNSIQVKGSATGMTGEVLIAGVSVTDANEVTYNNGPIRTALSYQANDFAYSVQGSTAAVDTTLTLPASTELLIGKVGTSYLGGVIGRVQYLGRKTAAADMPPLSRPFEPVAPTMQMNMAGLHLADTVLPGVEGVDYSKPLLSDFQYFADKNIRLFRLNILWERVQPVAGGALNAAYLGYIVDAATFAAACNSKIIIDVHNYGGRVEGKIGGGVITIAHFTDLWTRLATVFAGNPGIGGYDIMNEPAGMPDHGTWSLAAQAAVDAIRVVDSLTEIYVEGDGYATVVGWAGRNAQFAVNDPAGRVTYSAHCYLDRDSSGLNMNWAVEVTQGVTNQTGVTRVTEFVNWCRDRGVKGHLGEIGCPPESEWLESLDNTLAYCWQNKLPVAIWSAGPGWGSYGLSVQPSAGVDKAHIPILSYYANNP